MNRLIFLFVVMFMLAIPSICSAHPRVVDDCISQRCYILLFPVPHSKCECVEYYHYPLNYTPYHYRPAPPPRGAKPGSHQPPPHNHYHGPGPRR